MKKLGILFATIIMLVLFAVSASALEPTGQCGENVYWNYNSTTGELVISGAGDMANYGVSNSPFFNSNVRSVVIKEGVTAIGDFAFRSCTKLVSITIPDSVVAVGEYAFEKTAYYNDVNNWENDVLYVGKYLLNANYSISGVCKIKTGTVTIADSAFNSCPNLTSVTIPNSVITIGDEAFYYCTALSDITIGNGAVTISESCFYNCNSLKKITVGSSVKSIGQQAFYNCSALEGVYITDVAAWCNIDFPNYDSNPLYYAKNLYVNGKLATNITIPDSVTKINNFAFCKCTSLKSVIIGKNVTHIGESAFDYCSEITSFTFGENIEKIDLWAFGECNKLESVYITNLSAWCNIDFGHSVSNPLYYAKHIYLDGQLIEDLAIPNDVIEIKDYAFCYWKDLTSVTFHNNVTEIGEFAFRGCKGLKSILIPASVISIGDHAFLYCDNINSFTVEQGNEYYSSDNFGVLFDKNMTILIQYPLGSYLSTYIVPNSVLNIEENAFTDCKYIQSVILGESVTNVGYGAFYGCKNLSQIMLPKSLKYIEQASFYGCGIKDIYYTGTEEEWNSITMNNNLADANVYFNHKHCFEVKELESPTHIKEGKNTYICICDYSYDEPIAKLEGHEYTSEVTKEATHLAEGTLTYTCECGDHYDEPIEKLEGHTYTSEITKEATHLAEGTLTYTCGCGDTYYETIDKLKGHTYTSEVTKEATHLAEGTLTYTCECGDTYDEPIAKLKGHAYTSEVTKEATHLAEGTLTYTCGCGDTYDETIDKLKGHTYTSEVTKEATHLAEGTLTYTCECGDTYDESIDKLEEHSYVANVILPTCSEKGYTEHICECGKSYVSDYVGMIAHSYVYSVIKPSSHLVEGLGRYTCSKCGYHYDEAIAKTKEHSYIATMVDSTCTDQGYTLNECKCGDSYKTNYLAKIDHVDSNSDGVCDDCGYDLAENCSCNCHSGGIKGLIFRIILFFQKLFRTNQICEGCGIRHY